MASPMSRLDTAIEVLPEPGLAFRYGQSMADPHDGLTAFGPFDADQPGHPQSISLGVVGSASGVGRFADFSALMRGPILPEPKADPRLWPMFPGFEAAFESEWPAAPTRVVELDEVKIEEVSRLRDPYQRTGAVVDRYIEGIERIRKSGDRVDTVICVVPDFVYVRCRPMSRVPSPVGEAIKGKRLLERKAGQMELFDRFDPGLYEFSVDFRRQLKARSMEFDLPIQLLRESTLRVGPPTRFGERTLTPLTDRAWNLGVAIYYKSGGKPWRLTTAREGVCYIGIAYRKNDVADPRSACCAAQMFLDTGDGIVFMGEFGPWYSPERKQFHLERHSATRLLKGVLDTYRQLEGKPLKEIFLHCRSGISADEFAGFEAACPSGVSLVGVRVRVERRGLRLFREGQWPVLRGSMARVGDRAAFLWGSGFKPLLGTYDGWEVPLPLRVDVQHGKADVNQICGDILGLTKLNYNACRLGESEPVTVGFSDAVGEILVSNPKVARRLPQFKYYI